MQSGSKSGISRRTFFGTAGGAAFASGLAAQTGAPATPSAPVLAGTDDLSRGSDFLSVSWNPVSGADRYEVLVSWNGGSLVVPSASPNARITSLAANRDYSVTARAGNSSGFSQYSTPLQACTRPPQPNAPLVASVSMMQLDVNVRWDLTAFVSQLDSGSQLLVDVARVSLNGAPQIIGAARPLSGIVLDFVTVSAEYQVRLVGNNVLAPNGRNYSIFSLQTPILMETFGTLLSPEIIARENQNIRSLQRYFFGSR